MFPWKSWLIMAFCVTIFNNAQGNVVKKHEQPDDETVNINIKNGAGLKISYPAGEIIVPSERKNVRIKTIDVFEEKNSPPQPPALPAPPTPPKDDYKQLPNYFSTDWNPETPYKWQSYFTQNQQFPQKQVFASANKGRPNFFQISDDEVFKNDEDVKSFADHQYEHYDEFSHKICCNKLFG